MNQISTTGWIVIILLGGLLIGTNLSLIAALRNRNKKSAPPQSHSAWDTMKNPWDAEDRKWGELAEKVKHLPESQADKPDYNQTKE